MMRKGLLLSLSILIVSTAAFAQLKSPAPSPKASWTQTVGITDISMTYSRPGVKGRSIWGTLVPYDKVWRAGANQATTITFSDDVSVNGQKLAKGTYSLHMMPGRDEWTVIFNNVADQWGSYSYDMAKDALRLKVKPEAADFREWMGFEVVEMNSDTAKIALRWEKVSVPFTVNTDSTAKTLAAIRAALSPDWRTPYTAASFGFESKAASDAELNAWLDQSLKAKQNIANLWLKARIMERAGNKAEAIRYGEMAIAAATAEQADFASEVRRNVDNWKKK